MKLILSYISIVTFVLLSAHCAAQQDALGPRYTSEFVFKDGMYRSFEDFKNNTPVERIQGFNLDEIKEGMLRSRLTPEGHFKYTDTADSVIMIYFDSLWGYCEKNRIYLRFPQSGFGTMGIVGSISHVSFTYYSSGQGYFTPAGDYLQSQARMNTVEYLFDYVTGKRLKYHRKVLEIIFSRDEEVFEQYRAYKAFGKQRRKAKLYKFIGIYNRSNPIYFPN